MSKRKYKDFPFDEVAKAARAYAMQGAIVIQKWTCEGCGERLEGAPNHWFENGRCDQVDGKMGCGHVTDLRKNGCNYMLIQTDSKELTDFLLEAAKRRSKGGDLDSGGVLQ